MGLSSTSGEGQEISPLDPLEGHLRQDSILRGITLGIRVEGQSDRPEVLRIIRTLRVIDLSVFEVIHFRDVL